MPSPSRSGAETSVKGGRAITETRFGAEAGEGVLFLRGELDLAAEVPATRILLSKASRQPSLTLDLSGLTFCDSTGLRLLGEVVRRLPQDGLLRIVGANRAVQRLLNVSGLNRHPRVEVVQRPEPGRSSTSS